MFQGLEHTAIASPDPKRLAEWYVQKLDFRINYTYGGNYFARASNGTLLEFIPSEGDRAPQQMKDPGIRHLAIAVDDFDAAMEELRKRGVEFLAQPIAMQGNRLVYFNDADGNYLHLIQRPQPLP
jgi:catechol 2,3-dioxygenase-like lactoylglutathione lyase family enzyme